MKISLKMAFISRYQLSLCNHARIYYTGHRSSRFGSRHRLPVSVFAMRRRISAPDHVYSLCNGVNVAHSRFQPMRGIMCEQNFDSAQNSNSRTQSSHAVRCTSESDEHVLGLLPESCGTCYDKFRSSIGAEGCAGLRGDPEEIAGAVVCAL